MLVVVVVVVVVLVGGCLGPGLCAILLAPLCCMWGGHHVLSRVPLAHSPRTGAIFLRLATCFCVVALGLGEGGCARAVGWPVRGARTGNVWGALGFALR